MITRGTPEAHGNRPNEIIWLNTAADGWRSKEIVVCYDMSFRRLYDANRRSVIVRGVVREYGNWLKLEKCELVTDVAGLTPSTLSDSGEMQMQTYDGYGRTDGKWKTLKVIARPAVVARRLNGACIAVSSATAESSCNMGTTKNSFCPDGRFTLTNFTHAYASSASGAGLGRASIVVGEAGVGPNGTSVSSVGGGDDQGTYFTDGYTLELRTKSGTVFRCSIFSWDMGKDRDYLVINGSTYSPPKSRHLPTGDWDGNSNGEHPSQ